MIEGLVNGFPDGRLYVIISRQRGEVYEKTRDLFWTFLKIGAFTFGGGYAMVAPAGTGICGGQAVAEPGGISRYGRHCGVHAGPCGSEQRHLCGV